MAATFAGDTLPGHPPIEAPTAPRPGMVGGFLSDLVRLVTVLARLAATHRAWLADAVCLAAVVVGVALWFGAGPAWVAAGAAGLILRDYGGGRRQPPTATTGPGHRPRLVG